MEVINGEIIPIPTTSRIAENKKTLNTRTIAIDFFLRRKYCFVK